MKCQIQENRKSNLFGLGRKVILLAILAIGTGSLATAANLPLKNATVKVVKAKHPRHRKAKNAKMATTATQAGTTKAK